MRRTYFSIVALLAGSFLFSATSDAQDQNRSTSNPQATSSQTTTTVKQAIAKKLMMANKAEIELAQLAKQKSKNPKLNQIADKLISDHRQLNEKLQKWEPNSGNAQNQGATSRSGIQNSTLQDTPASEQRTGRDRADSMKGNVPQALCAIMDKASENALTMTKEMLQNYDGEEFDMAFVGQQVVAHMMLLAELKAIESQNLEEISQIAGKAASTTEQHLEELKGLAKELKDNSSSR